MRSALGIGAIVALLAVSGGAAQASGRFIHLGRSDLWAFQKGAADPTTSVLPTSLINRPQRQPGIANAIPVPLVVEDVARSARAIVFGIDARTFLIDRMVLSSGRMFRAPDEMVAGDGVAPQLDARIGSAIAVATTGHERSASITSASPIKTPAGSSRWRPLNRSAITPARRFDRGQA